MRHSSACPHAARSHANLCGRRIHYATPTNMHATRAAHRTSLGRLFGSPPGMDRMPSGDIAARSAGSSDGGWLPRPDVSAPHSLFHVVPCPARFVKGCDSHMRRNWLASHPRRGRVSKGGAV